jgi:hypothetical protein
MLQKSDAKRCSRCSKTVSNSPLRPTIQEMIGRQFIA